VVGNRKISIGDLKTFLVSFVTASTRLEKDDWVFDSDIKVTFRDFDVPLNIVN